ncbi:MAG: conserved membrane protein of unknown function [Promethearchaeota archaeon]|nr:MAG: conserved membrane protein of unknown function [Candidatus Lokiarchaeota archaeon]
MVRLGIGIGIGIALSFFSVSLFNQWQTFRTAILFSEYDILQGIGTLVEDLFEFDIINFFSVGPYTITNFFQPAFLACLLMGFVSGAISGGLKRGFIAGTLVIIISLLIWICLSIFSGQDLIALFQGAQLLDTIGGILGALSGGVLGGIAGGSATSPTYSKE